MQDNNTAEEIELVLPDEEVTEEAETEEVVEAAPEQKDELDDVSEGVKKRIDKLTYKYREAERQRDEALNYAKTVNTTNSELQEKLKNSEIINLSDIKHEIFMEKDDKRNILMNKIFKFIKNDA